LGWLRQIRHGETEVVNAIYFAYRQPNWSTDPANIDPATLKIESGSDHFKVSYRTKDSGRYVVESEITGDSHRIRYSIKFVAIQAMQSARVGICVLHPPTGDAYMVDHGAGKWALNDVLPDQIWPHPPVTEISKLRIERGGDWYVISFDSTFKLQAVRRFEMEDQRNWGDASYKTYHGPQADGGYALAAGEVLEQTIEILLPPLPSPAKHNPSVGPVTSSASAFPVPKIGVPAKSAEVPAIHSKGLRAILARTDQLADSDIASLFDAASKIGLDRLLYRHGNPSGPELSALKKTLTAGPTHLLLDAGSQSGTAGNVPSTAYRFDCPLGWLAPSNFTELNRARPWTGTADILAWSYQPQAHSQDVLSILESPAALADQFETAQASHGAKSVILGPFDFKMSKDERLGSIAGAIWLVGVLSSIAKSRIPVTHAILSDWQAWSTLSPDSASAVVFAAAIGAQGFPQAEVQTHGEMVACRLGTKLLLATKQPARSPVRVDVSLQGKTAYFYFDPGESTDKTEVLGNQIDHRGLWVAVIDWPMES
jgi:hypothetical protein